MISGIRDKEGMVLHVGTSQNYPRVKINKKQFIKAYCASRRKSVGEALRKYDVATQDEITKDNLIP